MEGRNEEDKQKRRTGGDRVGVKEQQERREKSKKGKIEKEKKEDRGERC
jgi:hypothetical protein